MYGIAGGKESGNAIYMAEVEDGRMLKVGRREIPGNFNSDNQCSVIQQVGM